MGVTPDGSLEFGPSTPFTTVPNSYKDTNSGNSEQCHTDVTPQTQAQEKPIFFAPAFDFDFDFDVDVDFSSGAATPDLPQLSSDDEIADMLAEVAAEIEAEIEADLAREEDDPDPDDPGPQGPGGRREPRGRDDAGAARPSPYGAAQKRHNPIATSRAAPQAP
jgi:hypothetical protein